MKQVLLSPSYQSLSAAFLYLPGRREGRENGCPTVIHDLLHVSFPNGRSDQYGVTDGMQTEYR